MADTWTEEAARAGEELAQEYEGLNTHEDWRAAMNRLSELVGDWQGIPIPISDMPLVLHDRHPLASMFQETDAANAGPVERVCSNSDVEPTEHIVNEWFCGKLNVDVIVYHRQGRAHVIKAPRPPDGSMDRLTFWLTTIGASDAWDLDAEYRARDKLRGLLTERQWRHYDLTGAFFETSPRSRLTYVFRRLRPTIAMTSRWPWFGRQIDSMKILAVLCLHPVGFYSRTWGGCMVPSDDVIAHVLTMRADEAYFWKKANQHIAWQPEAGL